MTLPALTSSRGSRAVERSEALSASAVADSPPRLGSDPNLWGGLLSANSDVVGLG
jgi:hypothetical protein